MIGILSPYDDGLKRSDVETGDDGLTTGGGGEEVRRHIGDEVFELLLDDRYKFVIRGLEEEDDVVRILPLLVPAPPPPVTPTLAPPPP